MSRQTLDDLHGEVAVAQITVTMTRNGNCKVEGAITDHDFAKFMLDTARDVVNNFHQRKQIMEGKGVIVISSELPELLGICDRIYALAEGRITGEVSKAEATPELLMKYMTTEKDNN